MTSSKKTKEPIKCESTQKSHENLEENHNHPITISFLLHPFIFRLNLSKV